MTAYLTRFGDCHIFSGSYGCQPHVRCRWGAGYWSCGWHGVILCTRNIKKDSKNEISITTKSWKYHISSNSIIHEEKRFFLFYWPLSQNPQCLAQCSLMFSEFLQGSEILFCLMYPIQSSSVSIGWNPSSLGHSGMCMQSTGIYANQVEW